MLALVAANLLAIGLPIEPVRFPDLVEICSSPLQAGLSELIPIGGAPLALELSALLGVCVRHYSSRRLLTIPRHCDDSTGRWRAAISGTKVLGACWRFWPGGGWPSLTDRSSRRPQRRTHNPGAGVLLVRSRQSETPPAARERLFDGHARC